MVQPVHCTLPLTSGFTSNRTFARATGLGKKLLKPIKIEKEPGSPQVANIAVHHYHHQLPENNDPIFTTSSQHPPPPPLAPYSAANHPTLSSSHSHPMYGMQGLEVHHNMMSSSPGMQHSPMVHSPKQCSTGTIHHMSNNEHRLPHTHSQHPQQLTAAQSSMYVSSVPSPSNGCLQMADPASPMQVGYSPAQPTMQMSSSGNIYNMVGTNNLSPFSSTQAGLHPPPPPNYSEAIGLGGGGEYAQMAIGYQSIPLGSEFPMNQVAALPGMEPPANHL